MGFLTKAKVESNIQQGFHKNQSSSFDIMLKIYPAANAFLMLPSRSMDAQLPVSLRISFPK